MSSTSARTADSVRWDLSDLYASPTDPAIRADQDSLRADAARFSTTYKGRLSTLTAPQMAVMLTEYERMSDTLGKMGSYAYLLWSTNTEEPAHGKLLQQITEFSSDISQLLVFFDVETLAGPDATFERWLDAKDLKPWHFFLESSRRFQPHILTEAEEQILTQKSVTGSQAWIRYFDETLGAARFELDGEKLPEQDVLSKLHEPDRELRERAAA
ncbi:MAG: hypothetical protein RL177_1155, partial [Bacteroidota bacterium]